MGPVSYTHLDVYKRQDSGCLNDFTDSEVVAMADDTQVSPVPLHGLDDSRQAALSLLDGMRRTLSVYVPVVRPELYNLSLIHI